MQHIVIDFEFTPVSKFNKSERRIARNEIIEIGAVRLDDDYNYIDSFNCYVKPVYGYLCPVCSELTGITQAKLTNAPDFEQAVERLLQWIGDEDFAIYEWSENDELQFRNECKLKNMSEKFARLYDADWYDIQAEYADVVNFGNIMSLNSALSAFGIDISGKLHDARDDAYNTAKILQILSDDEKLDACIDELDKMMGIDNGEPTTLGDLFGSLLEEVSA